MRRGDVDDVGDMERGSEVSYAGEEGTEREIPDLRACQDHDEELHYN